MGRDPLLRYAEHGRQKIEATLASVTVAELATPCPNDHPRAGETFAELLQVNLGHLVEHGSQMGRFVGH